MLDTGSFAGQRRRHTTGDHAHFRPRASRSQATPHPAAPPGSGRSRVSSLLLKAVVLPVHGLRVADSALTVDANDADLPGLAVMLLLALPLRPRTEALDRNPVPMLHLATQHDRPTSRRP